MCDLAALGFGDSSVSLISCKIFRKGTPRTLRSASLDELQCAMRDPLRYVARSYYRGWQDPPIEESALGQKVIDALYQELARRV